MPTSNNKTSTTTANNTAAAKEIKDLKKQIADMQELIAKLQSNVVNTAPAVSQPIITVTPQTNSLTEEVKIVHLVERSPGLTTHMEISNLTIDLNAFGEERTLDKCQAEELCGRYRRFFESGVIAFGAGCEDMARRFGLKTVSDYKYCSPDFISKLGTLSSAELEELFGKVSQAHKAFIVEYFKRKIAQGDPNFNNSQKIEMLNRVTGGAMSSVTLDAQRDAILAAVK